MGTRTRTAAGRSTRWCGEARAAIIAILVAFAGHRLPAETIFSTFGSGTFANDRAWYNPPETAQAFRTTANGYILTDVWLPLARDPGLSPGSQQTLTVTVMTSGTDGHPGNVVSGTIGSVLVSDLPALDTEATPTQQTATHFSNLNLALAPQTSYWLKLASASQAQLWHAHKIVLYTTSVSIYADKPAIWTIPDIQADYAMGFSPTGDPAAIVLNPVASGSGEQWTAMTATIAAVPEPSPIGLLAGLAPTMAVWGLMRNRGRKSGPPK